MSKTIESLEAGEQMRRTIDELRAEVERLRADAERLRRLRNILGDTK